MGIPLKRERGGLQKTPLFSNFLGDIYCLFRAFFGPGIMVLAKPAASEFYKKTKYGVFCGFSVDLALN
jgi:hypothetical protein